MGATAHRLTAELMHTTVILLVGSDAQLGLFAQGTASRNAAIPLLPRFSLRPNAAKVKSSL